MQRVPDVPLESGVRSLSCRLDGRDMFSRGRRTLLSFRLLESLRAHKASRRGFLPCRWLQNYQKPQLSRRPHAASQVHPFAQPAKHYLEIRDGRREGPEEKETAPLCSVCPPTLPLPYVLPDPGPSGSGVSQMPSAGSGTRDWDPSTCPATWDACGLTHGCTRRTFCHLSEMT